MRSTLISEVLWKWYFCVMKLETPQPSWHYWITNTNTIVLKNNWYKTVKIARLPDKAIKNSFPKETNSEYVLLYLCVQRSMKKIQMSLHLGTIQVLRHQRGRWVGSENGNFWWFTVLTINHQRGGWVGLKKSKTWWRNT